MSIVDDKKNVGEDSGGGKLLNDIESLGKALYLEKSRSRSLMSSTASSRSKSVGKPHLPDTKSRNKDDNKDLMEKDKKSIWNWKGFKALTHARDRRFNCYFSLHVHSIEGLPPLFDDLNLVVHWKRRDGELVTRPAMVCQGVVEFEERLVHSCSVYGRSGTHHAAKYEAKHFLLYPSVYGTPEVDLGKHRVDLTRLLPLTLEELEEEKSSGKWTTSYRLTGKAKGGILNVSFGYEVFGNNRAEPSAEKGVSGLHSFRQNSECRVLRQTDQSTEQAMMRRTGSLPARSSISNRSAEDIKELHEVLPVPRSQLSDSIAMLYKILDEQKPDAPVETAKPEFDLLPQPDDTIKPHLDLSSDDGKGNIDGWKENDAELSELKSNEQENSVEDIRFDTQDSKRSLEASDAVEVVPKDAEENTNLSLVEVVDCDKHSSLMEVVECDKSSSVVEVVEGDCDLKEADVSGKESLPKELDSALTSVSDQGKEGNCDFKEADISDKESLLKELDSALTSVSLKEVDCALPSVSDLGKERLDSPEDEYVFSSSDNHQEPAPDYMLKKGKSLNLDAGTDETVASEFLDLLGIEHSPFGLSSESDPESPRERLLRQFEKDTIAGGFSLFGLNEEDHPEIVSDAEMELDWGVFSQVCEPSLVGEASEELFHIDAEATSQRTKASMLEDMETEALMREWGLNEKAFLGSPPGTSGGFGSPIDMPQEIPNQLPSLGQGLGPFVQTESGEFLRAMNPALFRNAKNGGSLIMQVSSPVVMPAEMGSGVMDIMQNLAAIGIEKLSMQANKLMPLEDINGKTIQQISWEAAPTLDGCERDNAVLPHESGSGQGCSSEVRKIKAKPSYSGSNKFQSNSIGRDRDSEYVSLEDLAPLAMDKIEALAIEGLKIQSGMSDDVTPANINPQSIGEFSALEGKRVSTSGSIGLEGAGGLQLLDIRDNGDDVDGLMGLSLSLDEWMRLDSGEIYDDDGISERTSKLLAAHHAKSTDLVQGRLKGEKRRSKGKNFGLLGNNFNVALMVQLRDPLRDYEPVGAPMLALIQVERVFIPAKPKIYSTVSELRVGNEDDDDDDDELAKKDAKEEPLEATRPEEEHIPQFKIAEVHIAGLKTEPTKSKLWGSSTQQQSGSRWLLANGMGKKNKHPLMKSKAGNKSSLPGSTAAQPGDALWSMSSGSRGLGTGKKEVAKVNSHIRNPDVTVRNDALRLKQRGGFLGFI